MTTQRATQLSSSSLRSTCPLTYHNNPAIPATCALLIGIACSRRVEDSVPGSG